MFSGAAVFSQPIGSWNTANVTDMSGMFFDAGSFKPAIGSWEHQYTNQHEQCLFAYAGTFNQPIGSWNAASVTDMVLCSKKLLLSTSLSVAGTCGNVTSMAYMFEGAASFDQPMRLVPATVASDGSMFSGASSFNQPVSSWNICQCCRYMACSLTQAPLTSPRRLDV